MRLVFFGPPGAGKGTMAEWAGKRLRAAHLSSGDLLREAVRRQDPMGQEADRFMKEGSLVPDALVTGLILQSLDGLKGNRSFVLDGFPRTVEQAAALDRTLTERGQEPIDLAIDFEISERTAVDRLSGRRVCPRCRANYHLKTLPPRRPELCDRCETPLVSREDDRPQTLRRRLEIYETQTTPLLSFYKAQGKLRVLSGEPGIEEQYQGLLALLKKEHLVPG